VLSFNPSELTLGQVVDASSQLPRFIVVGGGVVLSAIARRHATTVLVANGVRLGALTRQPGPR